MKKIKQPALHLAILLVALAFYTNSWAGESEQQVTIEDLDTKQRFAVTASNIDNYLHAGDRIVVYDTFGRGVALIFSQIARTAPPAIEDEISGVYASRITGKPPYGTFDSRRPQVVLERRGQTITGTYGEAGGKIEGYIKGNVVKFEWSTPKSMIQSGIWKFEPGSDEVTGEWHVPNSTTRGGRWKLSRLSSPEQTTAPPVLSLRGSLLTDQTDIALELVVIAVIKISRDPAVIEAYAAAHQIRTECQPSRTALDAIERAETAYQNQGAGNNAARESIAEARRLLAAPQCDSERSANIAELVLDRLEADAYDSRKSARSGRSAGQLADECTDARETVAVGIMTAGVYFLVAPFYTATCMAVEAASDALK